MGEKTYEEITQSLETQYSSLDPALIRAFLSEYDYTDTEQLHALHDILENLRVEAVVDDSSSFDPSGTSGGDPLVRSSPLQESLNGSEDHTEGGLTTSSDTDLTNLSYDLRLTALSGNKHGTRSSTTSDDAPVADTRTAANHLLELFPSQTNSTVAYILEKCNGSFDHALDILLNHVYFDEPAEGEERILFKSVDAFGQGSKPPRRRRKGKQKSIGRTAWSDDAWSSQESLATYSVPPNHWQTAAKDIDFLATRTNASTKTVQSLYHEHGTSVPATILAITQRSAEARTSATSDDPIEELHIATLASEFPTIPLHIVAGLIRVTAPSTAHAHELAKALTAPSTRTTDTMSPIGGKLVPHYAPLHIDEGPATMADPVPVSTPLSATGLANLRSNAFSSASKYHRKAGSDRLFGGAAAYYGQLGRDYNNQLRAATATEADALVASQSSGSMIDLHGVSVADAVRIAESSTQSWWDVVRLKEGRSNSDRVGDGFVIVTGRGTHSKDGRARIGPAVTKALIKQGWKIEVRSGELAVLGRVKK